MSWMNLADGGCYDFDEPERSSPLTIDIIGAALSKLCRFTGHTKRFYSVAQHSVLVSCLCPRKYHREGLLHDALEAVVGDLSTPLKCFLGTQARLQLDLVERRVRKELKLLPKVPKRVKEADLLALAIEKEHIMAPSERVWDLPLPPIPQLVHLPDSFWTLSLTGGPVKFRCWSPEEAEQRFVARMDRLLRQQDQEAA